MINAFDAATAGARVQEARIDLLADRLSKVNAPTFKGDFMSIQAAALRPGAAPSPDKIRLAIDFTQGALRETHSPMDVGLEGKGMLVATDGRNRIYTRGGPLHIDAKGNLAMRDGLRLLNANGGPISVTMDSRIDITQDGKVWQSGQLRGTLACVDFSGREDLLRRRGSDFICSDPRHEPSKASPQVKQGMLEQSNVNGIRSMAELIEASRLFEASMRAVSFTDRSLQRLINDVGSIPS